MKFLIVLTILFSKMVHGNVVLGSFGPPLERVRDTEKEAEGAFSFRPYLGLFYRFKESYPYSFNIEFDYVFAQTSYSDMGDPVSKNRKIIGQLNMDYFIYHDFIYVIGGLATVATKVYGDGGSVTVSGSEFYLPGDDGDSSYNTLINLGLGLNLNNQYFGELKAHIWEVLNSQSRAVSLSLAMKARLF
jgi:hypothetical protein